MMGGQCHSHEGGPTCRLDESVESGNDVRMLKVDIAGPDAAVEDRRQVAQVHVHRRLVQIFTVKLTNNINL